MLRAFKTREELKMNTGRIDFPMGNEFEISEMRLKTIDDRLELLLKISSLVVFQNVRFTIRFLLVSSYAFVSQKLLMTVNYL